MMQDYILIVIPEVKFLSQLVVKVNNMTSIGVSLYMHD